MSNIVNPELKHFELDDLKVICEVTIEVVSLCINQSTPSLASIQELCNMLESNIDTSVSSELKASWAELALS
ncbi:hypothetical protein LguiB_025641 [Lonicera macranthoides]